MIRHASSIIVAGTPLSVVFVAKKNPFSTRTIINPMDWTGKSTGSHGFSHEDHRGFSCRFSLQLLNLLINPAIAAIVTKQYKA